MRTHDNDALNIAACALGYGIVSGLIFPLMIQGVFLQEIGLSHGAGESFGLLFFVVHAAAFLVSAAACRAWPRASGGKLLVWAGLAAAFVGNALMLLRTVGLLEYSQPYAFATAGFVGAGLAVAETGWIVWISHACTGRPMQLAKTISASYLAGFAEAAIILASSGPGEIVFALSTILVSAGLMASQGKGSSVEKEPAPDGARKPSDRDPDTGNGFLKAAVYLAVFSFVFGTAGQAGAAAGERILPVEMVALAGALVGATAALAASFNARRVLPVTDLYGVLFPLVAIALVALPFVDAPAMRDLVLALLFASFFFVGINARTAVCQLGWVPGGSAGFLGGCVLAAGGTALLGGIAYGSQVLAGADLTKGFALVSLLSLFVLSMATFAWREAAEIARQEDPSDPAGDALVASGAARAEAPAPSPIAERLGLTAREADVLALIRQGRTRTYIADELGISPNTVKGYAHSLYGKAGVDNKQALLDLVESLGDG